MTSQTIWYLLLLVAIVPTANAVETSYAKKFVLGIAAFPDSEVSLVLTTLEIGDIEVKLTKLKTELGKEVIHHIASISVSRENPQRFLPTPRLEVPPSNTELTYTPLLQIESEGEFSMQVHCRKAGRVVSSTLALPYHAWGRTYHVVTIQMSPFVIIMATVKTTMTMYVKTVPPGANETLGILWDGNVMELEIEPMQAVHYNKCSEPNYVKYTNIFNTSLTETKIEADNPVGVLTGSCTSLVEMPDNNCTDNHLILDGVMEWMLPDIKFGTEFITTYFPWDDERPGDILVITASEKVTKVYFSAREGEVESYVTEYIGEHIIIKIKPTRPLRNGYIRSDKPISVFYIKSSSCNYSDTGATMVLIFQNNLFFNTYIWVNPFDNAKKHFMIVVILEDNSINDVIYNNESLSQRVFYSCDVYGFNAETHYASHEGSNSATITANFNFGCYFYGTGDDGSYMNAAGAMFPKYEAMKAAFILLAQPESRIETTAPPQDQGKTSSPTTVAVNRNSTSKVATDSEDNCKPKQGRDGDGLDNDCDGQVDEEGRNDLDDDGDGKIDEDCISFSNCKIPGKWGFDCMYNCSKNCDGGCSKHKGFCNKCMPGTKDVKTLCSQECGPFTFGMECSGNCSEKCGNQDCTDRIVGYCPGQECPEYKWGTECQNSCPNCDGTCNRITGKCAKCLPGFKNPESSCNKACGQFEYGVNCAGNCEKTCGRDIDCRDRITGECPPLQGSAWYVTLAFAAIIFFVALTYFLLKKMRPMFMMEEAYPHVSVVELPEVNTEITGRSRFGSMVDSVKTGEDAV